MKDVISDEELKRRLSKEQYDVLVNKATEAPFSGEYDSVFDPGTYTCAACGAELFRSDAKYESTTPGLIGWPAFCEAINNDAIQFVEDDSLGMKRLEATCANCGGHLGHFFDDPSAPNGKHYCINSLSLDFKK